jgi:glycosyltransferase 2 family protein
MFQKKALQIIVTLIGLGLVFVWVDVATLYNHALSLGWALLGVVLIATVLRLLGGGLRCMRLFQNRALTLGDSVNGYMLSAYVSLFLPTAIGGDALRVEYISKRGQVDRSTSAAIVIAERASGLVAMVMLLFLAMAFLPSSFLETGFETIFVAVIAVGLGVVALILISRAHRLEKSPQWLKKFSNTLHSFQNKTVVTELVIWSLLIQSTAIIIPASVGFLSPNGGIEIAIQLAAMTPIVWIITMLPISLGGNGLREASYVAIAELLGMNTTIALTASLALTISNLLPSFVGVFVFNRWQDKAGGAEETASNTPISSN